MNKISKEIKFHDKLGKKWNTEYKTTSFIKRFNIFKYLITKYQNMTPGLTFLQLDYFPKNL